MGISSRPGNNGKFYSFPNPMKHDDFFTSWESWNWVFEGRRMGKSHLVDQLLNDFGTWSNLQSAPLTKETLQKALNAIYKQRGNQMILTNKQAEIAASSAKYNLITGGRRSGKSMLCYHLAIKAAKAGKNVLIVCPDENLSRNAHNNIVKILRESGETFLIPTEGSKIHLQGTITIQYDLHILTPIASDIAIVEDFKYHKEPEDIWKYVCKKIDGYKDNSQSQIYILTEPILDEKHLYNQLRTGDKSSHEWENWDMSIFDGTLSKRNIFDLIVDLPINDLYQFNVKEHTPREFFEIILEEKNNRISQLCENLKIYENHNKELRVKIDATIGEHEREMNEAYHVVNQRINCLKDKNKKLKKFKKGIMKLAETSDCNCAECVGGRLKDYLSEG